MLVKRKRSVPRVDGWTFAETNGPSVVRGNLRVPQCHKLILERILLGGFGHSRPWLKTLVSGMDWQQLELVSRREACRLIAESRCHTVPQVVHERPARGESHKRRCQPPLKAPWCADAKQRSHQEAEI